MTRYDKNWVVIITVATIIMQVAAILWWPGWTLFIACNVGLALIGYLCVKGDPRLHEADDA